MAERKRKLGHDLYLLSIFEEGYRQAGTLIILSISGLLQKMRRERAGSLSRQGKTQPLVYNG